MTGRAVGVGGGVGPVAVVTLCSTPRLAHVRAQLAALGAPSGAAPMWRGATRPSQSGPVSTGDGRFATGEPSRGGRAEASVDPVLRVVVWIGKEEPPGLDADVVLRVPPGDDGLRLAAARNAGAAAALEAGAELLIFLDADCVPGPSLVGRYREASVGHPDAALCGPVTYLPSGVDASDAAALAPHTNPHPARPSPADGEVVAATAEQYPLFWSLSFAMTADAWRAAGGFDEGYEGYGGEDTDFAFRLRDAGIPLLWVGGAHAYHQHHETESPPWRHLDDILRNGARFAARWGEWPMTGWLAAFADAGAIAWDGTTWRRVAAPRERERLRHPRVHPPLPYV